MTESSLIFFSVPVRNRAWALDRYFDGLLSLKYPKWLIHPHFFINDSTDETLDKVLDFKNRHGIKYFDCTLEVMNYGTPEDNRTADVTHALFPHFADLKNHVRNRFLGSGCDYWLMVDSDSPCQEDTLKNLLRHREGYVAGWCDVDITKNTPLASVMLHEAGSDDRYIRADWDVLKNWPKGELMEIGWAGGIVLIRRDVAEACHYHVSQEHRDDTLGFCREAERNGWTLYVDPQVFLEHYMTRPALT